MRNGGGLSYPISSKNKKITELGNSFPSISKDQRIDQFDTFSGAKDSFVYLSAEYSGC
jgi:hypothetical protein